MVVFSFNRICIILLFSCLLVESMITHAESGRMLKRTYPATGFPKKKIVKVILTMDLSLDEGSYYDFESNVIDKIWPRTVAFAEGLVERSVKRDWWKPAEKMETGLVTEHEDFKMQPAAMTEQVPPEFEDMMLAAPMPASDQGLWDVADLGESYVGAPAAGSEIVFSLLSIPASSPAQEDEIASDAPAERYTADNVFGNDGKRLAFAEGLVERSVKRVWWKPAEKMETGLVTELADFEMQPAAMTEQVPQEFEDMMLAAPMPAPDQGLWDVADLGESYVGAPAAGSEIAFSLPSIPASSPAQEDEIAIDAPAERYTADNVFGNAGERLARFFGNVFPLSFKR